MAVDPKLGEAVEDDDERSDGEEWAARSEAGGLSGGGHLGGGLRGCGVGGEVYGVEGFYAAQADGGVAFILADVRGIAPAAVAFGALGGARLTDDWKSRQ